MQMLEETLDSEENERSRLRSILLLIPIYNRLDRTEESESLLWECINKDFGRLPEITDFLMYCLRRKGRFEKSLSILERAEDVILSGNYDPTINMDSFYRSAFLTCRAIMLSNDDLKPRMDRHLMEKATQMVNSMSNPPSFYKLVCFSDLHYIRGEIPEALEMLAEAEKKHARTYGRNASNKRAICSRKTMCYVRLKDKNQAKKFLKKLKTYGDLAPYLSKVVKKMKHKPIVNVKVKKPKEQFSNPNCTNVEQSRNRINRFKVCAACGRVKYCSQKCQKAHWKAHKRFCDRDLKKSCN